VFQVVGAANASEPVTIAGAYPPQEAWLVALTLDRALLPSPSGGGGDPACTATGAVWAPGPADGSSGVAVCAPAPGA
jgi:hypothetical protein